MKSVVKDVLWTLLFAAVAFILLRISVQTVRIQMTSMEPHIQPGDWIMIDKLSYRFGDPRRGDVIVFRPPPGVEIGQDLIKRIIGKPGDTVEIRNNTVFVNGAALQEPYVATSPHYTMAAKTIPVGEYFVLGDNRDVSYDSHYGWLVSRNEIVGRAWIIIWPRSHWGRAPNYAQPGPDAAKKTFIDNIGLVSMSATKGAIEELSSNE
jgi:signal peptidase I